MTTTQRVIVSLLAGAAMYVFLGVTYGKVNTAAVTLTIVITAAITRKFRIEKKE